MPVPRPPRLAPPALLLLVATACTALAGRTPLPPPHPDPELVRVFRERAHVVGAYTVLDTVRARLGEGGGPVNAGIPLATRAAALGANAIVYLDTAYAPDGRIVTWDAETRRRRPVRALAIRLHEPYAGAAALCDTVSAPWRVRESACDAAVRADPADTASLRRLGEERLEWRDARGAEGAFRELVRRRPHDAGAHFRLGCALDRRRERTAALAAYADALRLDPDHAGAHAERADLLVWNQRRPADALPHLDALLRGGRVHRLLLLRGIALYQLGRDEEAMAAFLEAAPLADSPQIAWGWAATAASRLGRHAEAVAIWSAVLARAPGHFNHFARDVTYPPRERDAYERSLRAAGPRPPAALPEPLPPARRPPHPLLARTGTCATLGR